ncbi:MAG: carbohydrate ABC transporter permease [Candidatus Sumerlaeota bacterium]|nr:carbohydrate ABC transporter permease [Candidatus Sumerlaeota bacterium]
MTRYKQSCRRAVAGAPLAWTLAVFAVSLPFLVPLAWLISTAFKPDAKIFSFSLEILPRPATLDHFHRVLREFPFFTYMRNSVIVTALTVIAAVAGTCPVAYSCACLQWPDRRLVFSLLMLTMMLPAQVTMIPVFLIFRQLGWIDTFLPLIVPVFLGNAFFIFLLRQFFLGLPEVLIESARIDGASEPRILVCIVIPQCLPAVLTVALFAGMGAWNDFMGPLIYLMSEKNKTLALGLQSLMGQFSSEWGMLMAGALIMALPATIVFLVAQKYFIQGMSLSGIKG